MWFLACFAVGVGKSYMQQYRMFVRAFVILMPLCLFAQQETNPTPKLMAPLWPLFESLRKANVSGSLEFSGHCGPNTSPNWPHWRVLASSAGTPLQVARETFADDPTIQVTQDADGTVRMIQTGVPTDLLDLRINVIPHFLADYANSAKESILWTREVEAFRIAHHIPAASGAAAMGGPGRSGLDPPKSFEAMHDVTVSQAMDRILKAFPGIWVYRDCLQPDGKSRFVWFSFFSSKGVGFYFEE
jgi:hypothetical protein